ncbi:hypothetical protein BGZ96_010696 [Linnemannia gamsii]|uniref:Ig-like domain-containing protein n=1 Tax=Linnemannia gamsii TaxID=64522 RepID=A0ABQ7KCN8_9FUNG|nr:hypothetical protein BGZ96_010696 [Linnemannia gamsii]
MSDVTYPGVYIKEIKSQSSSIASGASAVPVFACFVEDLAEPTRITDWLSFTKAAQADPDTPFEFAPTNLLHVSMKTYFDNGGGYCWVSPIAEKPKTTAEKKEETLTGEGEPPPPDYGALFISSVQGMDDVTLIVAAGQNINSAITALCKPGETRFAILDGPQEALAQKDLLDYDSNSYAAVYYPWLQADWAKSEAGEATNIPPSAAVAGTYCAVDRTQGVWKAPANMSLLGGVRPLFKVSDDDQSQYMGPKAINMIREFRGTGPLIWGARTLLAEDDEWKYIPVRRLFNTVQKDIKRSVAFSLFEPNSQPTWTRIRSAIANYLHAIWKQGGLMGNTEQEAYFVQIGKGVTMTDDDIDNGRMIVKIGMAAVRPAEYIILQFTQDMLTS